LANEQQLLKTASMMSDAEQELLMQQA